VIGKEAADEVLREDRVVEEHEINVMPDAVTSAITEEDVQKALPSFTRLFTTDAWEAVLQLSNTLVEPPLMHFMIRPFFIIVEVKKAKPLHKCPSCDRFVNRATNKILCNCCQRWCHWECMGIKKKSDIRSVNFTCTICASIPSI